MSNNINKQDLVRGSLIGGAVGDALGYAVEFDRYPEIIAKYGKPGITQYELIRGIAEISDDTQMTLFTANGMLMGLTRRSMRGIGRAPEYYVEYAYQDWYNTQMMSYDDVISHDDKHFSHRYTWLSALPELYARRAPGNTCLTAISDMMKNKTPQNDSKGCGGVMRVAPYGLFCACHEVRYGIEDIDVAGGEIARLTHKHPLGWIPAIVLTHILYRIVKDGGFVGLDKNAAIKRFADIVNEALELLPSLLVMYPVSEMTWLKEKPIGEVFHNDVERQKELVERALFLASNDLSDIENIARLGEGWVGEETLAIAIYAVARHIDSFEDVLIAAVNHDGDSDSTGAVAGNIIGAIIGYDAIPAKFKKNLELHDVILAIADDLHQGCIISEYDDEDTPEKRQWYDRYCMMKPNFIVNMETKTKHQLGKEHTTEKPELLSGEERFSLNGIDLGLTVKDYWQFQFSNLVDNLGFVAEFLVAKALSKNDPDNANGWTLYDIGYRNKRIEVKATSYYQSWKESHIISEHRVFSIRKTHIDYQNSKSEMARQNDVYIFCLETEKPPKGESANPLDLENWTFYVVPTSVINDLFGDQKTLSLKRITQIKHYGIGLTYDKIKETVDKVIDDINKDK